MPGKKESKNTDELKKEITNSEMFRNFILTETTPEQFIAHTKTYVPPHPKRKKKGKKEEKKEIFDDLDEPELEKENKRAGTDIAKVGLYKHGSKRYGDKKRGELFHISWEDYELDQSRGNYKKLTLAYANNIHYFQGKTLSKGKLYIIMDSLFEKSMFYVAISCVLRKDQIVLVNSFYYEFLFINAYLIY